MHGGMHMIEISFPAAELAFTAVWLLTRLIVWKRQGRISWKREAVLLLMYINLAVIIRYVFFPKAPVNGHVQPLVFDPAEAFPFRVNLVPFVHLFEYDSARDIIWNIAGNMAMLVPSGILLPAVYGKLDRFWKVAAAGAGISLCIEALQLPFPSRASDVDDLILNTLGVAAGYGIYAAVRRLKRKARPDKKTIDREETAASGSEPWRKRVFGSCGRDRHGTVPEEKKQRT